MAFNFRLETLLRIRERLKEAAEMKFASLVLRRDKVQRALERERTKLKGARTDMERQMDEGIMSDEFQFQWLQISHLEKRCRELASDLERAEMDLADGRSELTRRYIEKELVESLKERDLRKYLQEVDRRLQKDLDDMASLRYGQQRNMSR